MRNENGNFQMLIEVEQPFFQQEMRACRPSLNSYPTTFSLAFSTIHALLAFFIALLSLGWKEVRFRYDDVCNESFQTCKIDFETSVLLKAPVYVYYELSNFSQNHFRFRGSVDYKQLAGQYVENEKNCQPGPLVWDNQTGLHAPCGLRSYYTWKDYYTFPDSWNVSTKNITWEYEIGNLYKPINDKYKEDQRWLKKIKGYEDEVTEDKFAIWMRTAPRPHFRKLLAKLNNDISPGNYTIDIDINFPKEDYNGKRYLVFNNLSNAGGRNLTLIGINILISLVYVIGSLVSSIINYKLINGSRVLHRRDSGFLEATLIE